MLNTGSTYFINMTTFLQDKYYYLYFINEQSKQQRFEEHMLSECVQLISESGFQLGLHISKLKAT